MFEDYVPVIEANFPSGAKVVMPKIKETSDKPVRFAFNPHHHGDSPPRSASAHTSGVRFAFNPHHHGDPAHGSQIGADAGATIVSGQGALDETKSAETGFHGGAPGRWEGAAKNRPDVAESKLKPPALAFPREMAFDDGKRRVELKWLGVAPTKGDGFVWLPKEKILFTGDAGVNGPHNFMGDANVTEWIKTLEAGKKLGAEKVAPGHGPVGGPEVPVDQQAYFVELQRRLKAMIAAKRSPGGGERRAARRGGGAEGDSEHRALRARLPDGARGKNLRGVGRRGFPEMTPITPRARIFETRRSRRTRRKSPLSPPPPRAPRLCFQSGLGKAKAWHAASASQ